MTKAEAERLLGLRGLYTKARMKSAFRKAAMRAHPDVVARCSGDETAAGLAMMRINEAHDVLTRLFDDGGCESILCEADAPAPSVAKKAAASREGATRCDAGSAASAQAKGNGPAQGGAGPSAQGDNGSSIDFDAVVREWNAFVEEQRKEEVREEAQAKPRVSVKEKRAPSGGSCDFGAAICEDLFSNHGIVYRFFEHFPYRATLLVAVLAWGSASMGADPTAMGFAWGAPNLTVDRGWILLAEVLAVVNLAFPLITSPLRWIILAIIGRMERALGG